jgi:hypothetical protein
MDKMTYNGWTNYATWRISTEIDFATLDFLGVDTQDWTGFSKQERAEVVEASVEKSFEFELERGGLTAELLETFLSDVNWDEIAEHITEQHEEQA